MSALGDRIHDLLKGHIGKDHAITAPQIGHVLGMDEREVRRHIAQEFRQWKSTGLLLCLPRIGFFFATEAEDIERRQALLISLKLEAATKLKYFQAAMCETGFGGLVTDRIPPTFTDESHPEEGAVARQGAKAQRGAA